MRKSAMPHRHLNPSSYLMAVDCFCWCNQAAASGGAINTALRVIEKSGALDMAQRMMQTCGQLFRYAVTTGRAERNPVADLRGALKTPVRKHHAHLTADDLPDYLEKLESYHGEVETKLAL